MPKELCSIVRAYHKRDLLREEFRTLFAETFIEKHELVNATDLAHFYVILCQGHEKFRNYAHKCISNLYFSFTGYDLAVISSKADYIQENDAKVYELLQKQVLRLIKKKEISGHDLKKVYENVRDLPFEGKYNLFIEELEKHLQELKYY